MSTVLKVLVGFVLASVVGFAQTTTSPDSGKREKSTIGQGDFARPPFSPATQEHTGLLLTPLVELSQPHLYAVSFLPLVKGNESVAFVISPTGQLGTIPMKDIAVAYKTGYRPFTAADLLAIANSIADGEKDTQRRIKELSEDYDALVARYNRLAAINSAPAVEAQPTVQPRPAVDERQAMRLMLFQSLLQRQFPAPPARVQMQTVDCTRVPALCANR
jgi:hypothetical protein